jgi:hypothetical protein
VQDFRGKKLVTHTGGLPGYVSRVALMPELRLGVAVFTNQESGATFDAIAWRVLDSYLGAEFDWLKGYQAFTKRIDSLNAAAELQAATSRDSLSKPSLPLEKYAGTYTDAWYGDIAIESKEGKLAIHFTHTRMLTGWLEHYQYDTFIARWTDRETRADAFITFALNSDGSIDQAKMKAVSPATDFSFDFQDLHLVPARKK